MNMTDTLIKKTNKLTKKAHSLLSLQNLKDFDQGRKTFTHILEKIVGVDCSYSTF